MLKRACFLIPLIAILMIPSPGSGWVEDGVVITYASYGQRVPQIAYTGGGNAIIAWEDDRNYLTESTNIYAQRVDTMGMVHWFTNGVPVCRADGLQEKPKICPDGSGGAFRGTGTSMSTCSASGATAFPSGLSTVSQSRPMR